MNQMFKAFEDILIRLDERNAKRQEDLLIRMEERNSRRSEEITNRNREIIQTLTEENRVSMNMLTSRMAGCHARITTLEDLEMRSMEKFIYEVERLNPCTRKFIYLKEMLGEEVFKRLSNAGTVDSNESIIEAIKERIRSERSRTATNAVALIEKYVKFNTEIIEEDAIEAVFQDVEEVLTYLPPEAEKKPKDIAKAILKLMPDFMWVREDDLTLRPELKAADRTALKAYVMGCMPPPYARKSKVTKKEKGPIIKTPMKKTRFAVKAQKPVVRKQKPSQNIKRTSLLCIHEWEYGHTEPYCYKKKAGESAKPHPGEEVLKKRMEDYVRRKEAELISAKRVQEAEVLAEKAEKLFGTKTYKCFQDKSSGDCNKTDEVFEKAEVGDVKGYEETRDKLGKKEKCFKLKEKKEVSNRAIIEVDISGFKYKALLDSGAFRSTIHQSLKKHCSKIKKLEKPFRVQAAGGAIYPVWEVGQFPEITVVDQDGHRGFVFYEVEALILDVQEWDDLILGNEILSRYNLDPFSALKRRMGKGKSMEEKPTFAKWFLDYVGEEESEMINVKSFYSGMDSSAPKNALKVPPYIFGADFPEQEEFMELENIDVGLGAAKSGQSDDNRMRAKIKDKVEAIDVVHFSSSPAWKTKFVELFESNFKAFGDAESSTQLSIITPIRCDLLPGERVGIQKQLPLGQEQENFLHKRIAHMEKAGIIYPNKNPTTAMSVLVVPKKGPKKFRLVVDFRPLNKITQRVNNTLPRIELQLNRVRANKFFAGFDLLSGFDYLACEEQAGQYFTFTTPWGMAYSFLGAPQGWCNTPSLFSMRQIGEVLTPIGLWPHKALQWIDDSIIMGESINELYSNVESFLRQIQSKKLRLNIDKCELVANNLVFCGRSFDKDGWKYDIHYAKGLLNRVKPVYLHELAQLIYTAKFISPTIPGFSRMRKIVLGSHKIGGKMRNLEKKKLKIIWDEEMEMAYTEMIEAIKRSMECSIGYYDPEQNIYLFTDASEFFYSLFITQSAEAVDVYDPFKSNFRVIAINSGGFTGSQIKWHISCKELFPVLMAIKKYHFYLRFNAKEKILFTDHKNVVNIINPIEVKLKSHGSILSRWALDFMEINLQAYHLEGYKNIPADCLSRWLNPKYHDEVEEVIIQRAIFNSEDQDDEIEFWRVIDEMNVSPRHPGSLDLAGKGWEIIDDKLILMFQKRDIPELEVVKKMEGRMYVTKSILPLVIMHTHFIFNHSSVKKEINFIKENYYFEKDIFSLFKKAIIVFHRQCMHCQKPSLVIRRPLNVTAWGSKVGEVLLSDFLYVNKKGWILTLVDSLTRTTILKYCDKATSDKVVSILWDWHAHFQLLPAFTLVTDRGSHFTSEVLEQFLKKSGCAHQFSATYVSHTAGAVEVQNKTILRNLRSIVSEWGLGDEEWPDVLPMVQAFINQSPFTCRGMEMSPLQLMIGVGKNGSPLGAVYKEMEKQDYNKLKEASLDLRQKIIELQMKADKCGLEHRMKVNKRRNMRGKLKPIYFGVGEFVWLSEKEAGEGRRDKLKPRWCGPYQVIECISEHIYVIQDVDGKKKTRHSMLLAPYAPIGFLPSPATSLVYRMDKGKLELDKLIKLVEDDEGQLKFLCRWRGFSEKDDTFEPALTIFEDLPHLVIEFCRDNKSLETIQLMDFLMTIYPDSEYLGQIETQRKIFAMNEKEVSSFEEKLIFGKILIDEKGNWNRLNWSTFELQSLRVGLLSRGFGNFEDLKLFIPGKSK
eukprot:augustus_masked-scaffold_32-processed-gene-3.36-mRNA-1 protein AED:1.00 eAED:1.00 QI:0/-1/0/0/-1/1/1/0/1737